MNKKEKIIAGIVLLGSCFFWVYMLFIHDDPSGIDHPQYAQYVRVFHNVKCATTGTDVSGRGNKGYDREYFLKNIEELKVSHKKALKIFKENFASWQVGGEYNQLGAWKNCPRASKNYFIFAITVLEEELAKEQ